MSEAITPIGVGPAAMGLDRRPRQQSAGDEIDAGGHAGPPNDAEPARGAEQPFPMAPPADTPAALIPGALFSASVLAQRMHSLDLTLRVLHARGRRWSPPESDFRLKDTSI